MLTRGTSTDTVDRTLAEALGRIAAREPDRTAVIFHGAQITYGELDARADRFARALATRVPEPGARIALCCRRQPDLIALIFGCWRAGHTYLPLDVSLPPERIRAIVDDARPSQVVVDGVDPVAPGISLDRLRIDHDTSTAPGAAGPSDLAYLIYTSGSTGRPKPVGVPHAALTAIASAVATSTPGLTTADVVLAVSSTTFDISMIELVVPLTVGASIVLADDSQARSPREILDLIDWYGVTLMQATPSLWRLLVAAGWEQDQRRAVRGITAGEPLTPGLGRDLAYRLDALYNMYGPTEATIYATFAPVDNVDRISLGGALAGVRLYVLDRRLELVPFGARGELYLGGAGIADGYPGSPGLTADRFVPDPFASAPGARMYRTGDMVRLHPDGWLQSLGRRDRQVKVNGQRVEPGEVESLLERHPSVHQVAVVPAADATGATRLVAYAVLSQGAPPPRELRRYLREQVPDAMVPAVVIPMDELPLTPAGKVDVRRLPAAPLAEPIATSGAIETPATATEEVVCRIWAEVQGVESVSPTVDFFDSGGHSLQAIGIIGRIEQELGVPVPLGLLFDAGTPRELARRIDESRTGLSWIGN